MHCFGTVEVVKPKREINLLDMGKGNCSSTQAQEFCALQTRCKAKDLQRD